MIVIWRGPGRNSVKREKLRRDAGILAQHEIGLGENFERSKRDIGAIADRRGGNIQSGRERPVVTGSVSRSSGRLPRHVVPASAPLRRASNEGTLDLWQEDKGVALRVKSLSRGSSSRP